MIQKLINLYKLLVQLSNLINSLVIYTRLFYKNIRAFNMSYHRLSENVIHIYEKLSKDLSSYSLFSFLNFQFLKFLT